MSTKYQEQLELDSGHSGSGEPGRKSPRSLWNWFGATFGIVVLVGGLLLYLAGQGEPAADDGAAAPDQPTATEPADAAPDVAAEPTDAAPDIAAEPADEAEATFKGPADEHAVSSATQTSSVVLGIYVVDSFGFHAMEEAYAEATEVGERDAGRVAKVLAVVDAVEWPADLSEAATTFRGDLEELVAALEAGDLEGARVGYAAIHGSQHDLSNSVYAWLAGEPVQGHGNEASPADQAMEIIEIDMFEFGYAPEAIDVQAGVPVILRFTNSGKLEHEAMVGDAHLQEEWAEASSSGGHDATDGHHGDLMAVTVLPGETQDLEVLIDQPGTWYMACHLVGHYESGQIATINVNA